MPRILSLLILALIWIILCVVSSGCSAPAAPIAGPETGHEETTVTVLSLPKGAEVYHDGVFRGHTPIILEAIPGGKHVIRLTMNGYESWSVSFFAGSNKNETIAAELIAFKNYVPVTTVVPGALPLAVPEIHVDGYWEYPQGRMITENPIPLVIHTEAFNTGEAGAREISVSANIYYRGRMACWNTLYLGTLAPGGHVSRESLVSCTLPLPISEASLELKFENIAVKK